MRCFSSGDRAVASEVIWLRLRGDRCAGAGVARAAAGSLGSAGVPALARRAAVRGAALPAADRARRPVRRRLVRVGRAALPASCRRCSSAAAVSDIAWARTRDWRLEARRPLAGDRRAGDPRHRPTRRGDARARLARVAAPPHDPPVGAGRGARRDASAARTCARRTSPTRTPSELLSAELDHFARDRVYEEAVCESAVTTSSWSKRRSSCSTPFVESDAPGAGAPPVEGRAAAAGLLDEEPRRRRSPTAAAPGRRRASSAPSATRQCCQKSPRPRIAHARADDLRPARRHLARRPSSRRRSPRARDRRDAARLAVAGRTAQAPSPRAAHQRRPSAGADTSPTSTTAVALEREQRAPDRDAAHVVHRPVDRVDDPARRAAVVAELLAVDALARALARHEGADRLLGGAVGLRDRASGRASSRRRGRSRGSAPA